ncbi:FAD-binding protein [Streptomyces sp. Root369]|uniref:FAD-dependent oxidoreductase n=1 Tax=Streptomyces sp. Root369 TaxID=1736523 RepID=UPI00070E2B25|nr:FAD-binding protein [Streptomyces sp. Root369]KQW13378.1 FAD-linked oxidase [Streptomyces sp. Root369]
MSSAHLGRRSVLAGGAAAVGTAALTAAPPATAAADSGARAAVGAKVSPRDPRYELLTTGINKRFVARPEYIKMIRSAADAERALREAFRSGKRVSVRSGGHCVADFTCNPDVEVILDFSEMTGVGYDPRFRAFYVEAGARLYNVYEALYKGWGVTIPGGVCHSVGAGGHVSGGGYGMLSRAYGLVVDHLYAVQVVTVDANGKVRTVIATREEDDPNRDLWWAHTGGGGGNFGLATRYWFRSPEATGSQPGDQLVNPPSRVWVSAVDFRWEQLDETSFGRLLKNFGSWHQRHSGPDDEYRHLSSLFNVNAKAFGRLSLYTQIDATIPHSRALLDSYLAELLDGTGIEPVPMDRPSGELAAMPNYFRPAELPWLAAARMLGAPDPVGANPIARVGLKSAYFRENFTDHQVASLYRFLSDPELDNPDTTLVLLSFGGLINGVEPHATASAQRDSVFKVIFQNIWSDEKRDERCLRWIREWYQDVFAETEGVPETDGVTDGCYINYPDTDMADPRHNRSGLPWHALFYKDNYRRLQEIKRHWDPADYFRHSLSITTSR